MRQSVKWPSSCFVRWVFLCSVAPLSANTGMTCDQTQRRMRSAGQLCETPIQLAEPLLKHLGIPILSISRSPLAVSAHRRLALVKHLPSWTVMMPLAPWRLGRAQSGEESPQFITGASGHGKQCVTMDRQIVELMRLASSCC